MSSALPSMTVDEIFHDSKAAFEAQQAALAAAFEERAPVFLGCLDRLKEIAPGFKTSLRGEFNAEGKVTSAYIITNIPVIRGVVPAEPSEDKCVIIQLIPTTDTPIHESLAYNGLALRHHVSASHWVDGKELTATFKNQSTLVEEMIAYLSGLIHDRGMATSPSAGGRHPKPDPADTNQPVCR